MEPIEPTNNLEPSAPAAPQPSPPQAPTPTTLVEQDPKMVSILALITLFIFISFVLLAAFNYPYGTTDSSVTGSWSIVFIFLAMVTVFPAAFIMSLVGVPFFLRHMLNKRTVFVKKKNAILIYSTTLMCVFMFIALFIGMSSNS